MELTVQPGHNTDPQVLKFSSIRDYDLTLVTITTILLLIGLLMVYSASMALADGDRYISFGSYYFITRHCLFLVSGLLIGGIITRIPMKGWQNLATPLFLFALVLLVIVLIPRIGHEVNGARRWIRIPILSINFQPSEFMKVAMLLYASDYMFKKQQCTKAFAQSFYPMIFTLSIVGTLLLLESDLGAFVVITFTVTGILFLGGVNGSHLFRLCFVFIAGSFMLILVSPWRRIRLFSYLDPWNNSYIYSGAYQLSHSLIALGRGQWLGVGLGNSIEKLHYLPEAHTDFLLSVVGEELGLVGVMLVLTLFVLFIHRSFTIAYQSVTLENIFSGLVAYGIAICLGSQSFINLGVCLGLLPTKGLTLPFISYGGSSIVCNLSLFAMLLRIDLENRILLGMKHA